MTDRPRVDIVNFNFLDWDGERLFTGGAERYVLELVRLLDALGFAPRIVQNANRPFSRVVEGVTVAGIPAATSMDLAAMSAGFAPVVRDAALVIASPVDLAIGLASPAPVIGINHGIYWDYPNNHIEVHPPQEDRRIVDAVRACAACVCVDSNFPNWLRCFDADAAARVRRIANFVDLDRFRAVDKRFDGRLEILFPRRLCLERGFRDVVEAFDLLLPRHPGLDLHLCGEGPAEDEAIAGEFVARHPGRVRWSRLAMDEMPLAYAASHVVLVPTVFAEGTSLSCLEAMATRNAVVTTNVGRAAGPHDRRLERGRRGARRERDRGGGRATCSPTAAGPSASRSMRSPWCPPSRGRAGARSGSTCCTRCSPSFRTHRRSRRPRSRRRASSSA